MKSFIVKCVLAVCIAFCCLFYLDMMYEQKVSTGMSEINAFNFIPEHIQLANVGSSHGQCAFDWNALAKERGYETFNFALTSQSFLYDYSLINMHRDDFADGSLLFIPVSYFSFNEEATDPADQEAISVRYYRLLSPKYNPDYSLYKDLVTVRFPILSAGDEIFELFKPPIIFPSLSENRKNVVYAAEAAETKHGVVVQDTAWEGYTDIPLWIMQGYTTMGYEIVRQLESEGAPPPTHLFLQAGVGSMAGAMAGFFSSYYEEQRPFLTIVEPNKANCIFRTAQANDGTLHFVTGDMDTIMAGLACGEPCTIAWDVLRECADAFLSCPEYAAADGMRILAAPQRGDTPIVSGESGAASLGCAANLLLHKSLLSLREALHLDENSRLLFISTEGDTDRDNYRKVVWGGKYSNGFAD